MGLNSMPVSYTHLDVYKRQGGTSLEKECEDARKQIEKKQYMRNLRLAGYTTVPVSYTHLDVYKRQVQERAVYRDSIYRERAVASERVRLAMGMSLRPEDKAVHIKMCIRDSQYT